MKHVILSVVAATVVGIEAWFAWTLEMKFFLSDYEAMARSEIERPFVYRSLLPLLSQTLERLFGTSLFWLGVLFVASAIGFYFAMKYLDERTLVPFLACQILFVLTIYRLKPYDYATAMFFTLSLGLLKRRKLGVFLAIFALATLNRETTFLLIAFCAVWLRDRPRFEYFFVLSLLVVIYGACTLLLREAFRGNGGQTFYITGQWVVPTYLHYWYVFLPLLLLLLFRFEVPEFVRVYLWVVLPIQIVLHLILGMPFELRVFVESVPMLIVASRTMTLRPLSYSKFRQSFVQRYAERNRQPQEDI